MNVEIGTVAAQFLFWEYLSPILGIVFLQCVLRKKRVMIRERIKQSLGRYEYGEMNITKLNQRIDDIEVRSWRKWELDIAGNRHSRVPLFRYRNSSGIGIFVHSGTGRPGCRTVRHFGILKGCCWWWCLGNPVHVQTVGSLKWYTLHVHRQLLMVLFLQCDNEKSYVYAGMPEKS